MTYVAEVLLWLKSAGSCAQVIGWNKQTNDKNDEQRYIS